MSKASSRLTEQFRRAGWLPASDAELRKWVKQVVDEVTIGKRRNAPLLPVIQEFQNLIEENSELYMGFNQMFEQQPPSSLLTMVCATRPWLHGSLMYMQ